MVCIYCGSDLRVTNSRSQHRFNRIWRRRRCTECGAVFTSHEALDLSQSLSVRNAEGNLTPFLRDKLLISIYQSSQHRSAALSDASALTDTIITQVSLQSEKGLITTQLIRDTAHLVLQRFDKVSAIQYQAFHP